MNKIIHLWQTLNHLDGWPRKLIKWSIIFSLFWAICWTKLDPDFGWHLQTGTYIWQHGIPLHDLYSYTASNFRWIDHEWGNDVIVSLLYTTGGYMLLSIVFAGLWTVALMINNFKTSLLVLLLAFVATSPYAGIRPIAWTVLFFSLLLKILTSWHRWNLYFLPLLFIVWANLHAGFIAGLSLLIYFAIKQKDRMLALVFLVCTLMTIINPYGIRLYSEVFRTLADSAVHHQIGEWQYVYFTSLSLTFIILWSTGFWLFRRHPIKNWLGIGPILLATSLDATRNVPLFITATTKDLDIYWHQFKDLLPDQIKKAKRLTILSLLGIITVWLGILLWLQLSGLTWHDRLSDYPVQAVSYLKTAGCRGQLFNDYNYGGYLIWQLPKQPVFIAGHMTTWKNEQGQTYLNIYLKILSNHQFLQSEFKKYDIRCVLLGNNYSSLIDYLHSVGWKTTVDNNNSTLLINY